MLDGIAGPRARRCGSVAAIVGSLVLGAGTAPNAGSADPAQLILLPDGVLPRAVSATGAVVVGGLGAGGGFYWMPTTGVIYIGGKEAVAVSRDGRTIVGTGINASTGLFEAGIWVRAAEWRLLGTFPPSPVPCDQSLSTGYSTSGNGRIVVGLGRSGCSVQHAFRWDESTGNVDLGSTVARSPSRANRISADGKVIVGWQQLDGGFWQGARWVDGKQTLFRGPRGPVGEAQAVNVNGTIVAGTRCDSFNLGQNGWVSTESRGVECLPPPRMKLSDATIEPLGLSDDGRVIGGAHTFGLDSEAVLWFERSPVYLKDYMRTHGVPQAFEGWVNTGFITGVSPDGRVVVGYGAGPKNFQGYVVILGGSP